MFFTGSFWAQGTWTLCFVLIHNLRWGEKQVKVHCNSKALFPPRTMVQYGSVGYTSFCVSIVESCSQCPQILNRTVPLLSTFALGTNQSTYMGRGLTHCSPLIGQRDDHLIAIVSPSFSLKQAAVSQTDPVYFVRQPCADTAGNAGCPQSFPFFVLMVSWSTFLKGYAVSLCYDVMLLYVAGAVRLPPPTR